MKPIKINSNSQYFKDRFARFSESEFTYSEKVLPCDHKNKIEFILQKPSKIELYCQSNLCKLENGNCPFLSLPFDIYREIFKWFITPKYAFGGQWLILKLICKQLICKQLKDKQLKGPLEKILKYKYYVKRIINGDIEYITETQFKSKEFEWLYHRGADKKQVNPKDLIDVPGKLKIFGHLCIQNNCNAALKSIYLASDVKILNIFYYQNVKNPNVLDTLLNNETYNSYHMLTVFAPEHIWVVIENKRWRSLCGDLFDILAIQSAYMKPLASLFYSKELILKILSFNDWTNNNAFIKGLAYILFPYCLDNKYNDALFHIVNDPRTMFNFLIGPEKWMYVKSPPSIIPGSLIAAYIEIGFYNITTKYIFEKFDAIIKPLIFEYANQSTLLGYIRNDAPKISLQEFIDIVLKDKTNYEIWSKIPEEERMIIKKYKSE
jgi:hypothetical protein